MKKRIIPFVAVAALAVFSGAPLSAAEPNLSGDWKLNLAKSDYGMFPKPTSVTRKIDHNGSKLILTTLQTGGPGEVNSKLTYTTDGKESVNEVAGGQSKGTAQWVGSNLIIESAREIQGIPLQQKEIWKLSSGGKVLTIDSHVTIPNGEFDVKQVFEKQ